MAKGDDSVRRKNIKAKRKKLNKEKGSSNVSARVASIIAAKKRRQSGKRSMCQGMCFSLPTPDDPFNDRLGKNDIKKKERKKVAKGKSAVSKRESFSGGNTKDDNLAQKMKRIMMLKGTQKQSLVSINKVGQKSPVNLEREEIKLDGDQQEPVLENANCPSKFLIMCLNEIENAFSSDGINSSEDQKPLFVNTWGVEYLKFYSAGSDVLETSGSSSTMEQIAWMASIAADSIARKEKEGLLLSSPFLLFLVSSQEKAVKVRSVCKPLKALGIHTVSLHYGASLDHQINGLKSCEPEFLVSTPERLLELVSLKAIDISGVSFLVVDELQSLSRGGYLDALKSIQQAISRRPHTVVFNDCFSYASNSAVQNLLVGSISRLSLNDSVASQSACIIQSVNVCASSEEIVLKCTQSLDDARNKLQLQSQSLKVLYIIKKDGKFQNLGAALKLKGYSILPHKHGNILKVKNSLDSDCGAKPLVSIIDIEHINNTNLGDYEIVILPDFVPSIEDYIQVLTRMARCTVNGMLHSFVMKDAAALAGPLVEILEECGQAVPEALSKCISSLMQG